ncbi:hypothetical protein [Brevibacillus porteri]|uniref:hypothetical protein n=1 Tax=Brevibacillus porteri TaxID=2126350 RepID=UPI001304981B|nr:hypothetical protein [Brevibacillus porteri]MED1802913.1 hypothetical protein [Brevibacillus porteri]MED2135089.1 hypothetical protein [Brevibacillus porteri]MED2746331.1 hypothetical protein [Brevibacillus porteri]MED2817915.1 hypothetical protein [Brevibacillus porteri]MED2895547.1 hypothetical protein [Brevibacillus porteri]
MAWMPAGSPTIEELEASIAELDAELGDYEPIEDFVECDLGPALYEELRPFFKPAT